MMEISRFYMRRGDAFKTQAGCRWEYATDGDFFIWTRLPRASVARTDSEWMNAVRNRRRFFDRCPPAWFAGWREIVNKDDHSIVLDSTKPSVDEKRLPVVDLRFGSFTDSFLVWRIGCLAKAGADLAGPLTIKDDMEARVRQCVLFRLKDGVRGMLMAPDPPGEMAE